MRLCFGRELDFPCQCGATAWQPCDGVKQTPLETTEVWWWEISNGMPELRVLSARDWIDWYRANYDVRHLSDRAVLDIVIHDHAAMIL